MKYFKLFSLILLLSFLCVVDVSWASNEYDCGKFTPPFDNIQEDINEVTYYNKLSGSLDILTKQDLQVAGWHLYSSCCKIGALSDKCSDNNNYSESANIPESPFMLDHILDVGFRKFDGKQLKDYEYKGKKMQLDQSMKKRIKLKDKIAQNPEGYKPSKLMDKFDNLWQGKLNNKYDKLCGDVQSIATEGDYKVYENNEDIDYFVKKCNDISSQINLQEIEYMRILLNQVGSRYIQSNITKYTESFRQKFDKLIVNLGHTHAWFEAISHKVQEGTNQCNQ